MAKQEELVISKGTKITMGVVLFLLGAGVSMAGWATSLIIEGSRSWQRMEHDIVDIRKELKTITKDLDGNSRNRHEEVRRWVKLLGAMNPELQIPDIE
jgi:hypothetical protein